MVRPSAPSRDPSRLESAFQAIAHNARAKALAAWRWLNSDDGRGVLKCTLAYLLGSIATFLAAAVELAGPPGRQAHRGNTDCVLPPGAKQSVSMLEAILISIIAVAYAEIIAVLSMAVSIASRHHLGLVAPAHAVVLIVFVGGGLGFIGWVKQRMNQPLVNVSVHPSLNGNHLGYNQRGIHPRRIFFLVIKASRF